MEKNQQCTKTYICVCGATYTNPQAFNGHKRHCISVIGQERLEQLNQIAINQLKKNTQVLEKQAAERKIKKLQLWISEKHTCEKCGKVMTEKYGSGRFCSRSCANSHKKSTDSRLKLSNTMLSKNKCRDEIYFTYVCTTCCRVFSTKASLDELSEIVCPRCLKEASKQLIKYDGPSLPDIDLEHRKQGFFSRKSLSYAEQFWKKVFDNNDVVYIHDYVVQKPKGESGVYRLDFLINGVDVEIDGQLHNTAQCKEKDQRRTEYLNSLGYSVYRIPWINPINDKNKIAVNDQINALFNYLKIQRVL